LNHYDTRSRASDPQRLEALRGQVAFRLAGQLSRASEALPHEITERLRFAREHALAAAQRHRPAVMPGTAAVLALAGRSAALGGGPPSVWLRLASALPLLVLLAGLVLIQQHYDLQQIQAAAEIDSALLADDLPPDAYRDPGFAEYLRTADAP
jgi:hypothetical protein